MNKRTKARKPVAISKERISQNTCLKGILESDLDIIGEGAEGIISNKGKKKNPQENHNIEGAYSMPRDTKNMHRHNLISDDRGGGRGGIGEDLKNKNKKEHPGRPKKGKRILLASNFS